jgi:hypothetical protein
VEGGAALWWRRGYFHSLLELVSRNQPYFASAAINPLPGWPPPRMIAGPEPEPRCRATLGRVIAAHIAPVALILLRNFGLREFKSATK